MYMNIIKTLKKTGLRTRIIIIVMFSSLTLTLVILLQFCITLYSELSKQIERNAVSIGNDLASRSVIYLLTDNLYALHTLSLDTMNNHDDIAYIFYQSDDRDVLIHTFDEGFPSQLLSINHFDTDYIGNYSLKIFNTEEGIIRDVAIPVIEGQKQVVRVGLLDHTTQAALSTVIRQVLIITSIIFILSSFVLYMLIYSTINRPLSLLMASIQTVSEGIYTDKIIINSGGELQKIASAFNIMMKNLDDERKAHNLLLEKIINAQEDERKRIAGELHDETGQSLASLMIAAHLIKNESNPAIIKHQANEFHKMLHSIVKNLRILVWKLSPIPLSDHGLEATLEAFIIKLSKNHHWNIVFKKSGLNAVTIPYEVEIVVYRVIQEALTNISKHAHASKVEILIRCNKEQLDASIQDDGVGFDLKEKTTSIGENLGLASMKERILSIEGTLNIKSSPGYGTSVIIIVPISNGQ